MPLPIWLIPVALKGAAVVAGATGVGAAAHGAMKMKEANDTTESATKRHEKNVEKFEKENETTTKDMDKLGKLELEILYSFSEFSDIFEQIKNRPIFETYSKNGVTLPKYDGEKIKDVSIGAGVLLGGIGGAGLGAAGGFAAAGATTAAVMALGTASTGTAIASLSGAAATNATLALLGGGTLAAGGGGMAAGAAALSAATLGVGLLIGGVIFSFAGGKLSDKADEAWAQMKKAEEKINTICNYLVELRTTSNNYYETLSEVNIIYQKHLNGLKSIVTMLGHTDWNTFSMEEKKLTENTVLLIGLLYNMCKVELVIKTENEDDINTINKTAIENSITSANVILVDNFYSFTENKKQVAQNTVPRDNNLLETPSPMNWEAIKATILQKSNIDELEYYRWLNKSTLYSQTDDTISILFPSQQTAIYVKAHYHQLLRSTLQNHMDRNLKIRYGYLGEHHDFIACIDYTD